MTDNERHDAAAQAAEPQRTGLWKGWNLVKTAGRGALVQIEGAPYLLWIGAGFFCAYLAFFITPIFLTAARMRSPQVVPVLSVVGPDLRMMLTFLRAWREGGTPYIASATYPPLAYVLFEPFRLLAPSQRYVALTSLTLIAYGLATLIFPLKAPQSKDKGPIILLVLATGLMSYGLQFELERGQFDVIAAALAYMAILTYHSGRIPRIWAFVLLSLAVQLKLYPFIFVLLLVDDWRDWRRSLKPLGLFAAVNFALLFALGPAMFLGFANAVLTAPQLPGIVWVGDHSIHSFVGLVAERAAGRGYAGLAEYARYAEYALIAIVGACLLAIIFKAYREHLQALNPGLLMACATAAALLPSVSNDYKLSILAGPAAVFLVSDLPADSRGGRRILLNLLTFVVSLAYASTLFPYTYKPEWLAFQSATPALFVILLGATAAGLWSKRA